MVQILVIAAMALAALGDATPAEDPTGGSLAAALTFGWAICGGALIAALARLGAGRMDRSGDARPLLLMQLVVQIYRAGALATYGAAVVLMGWLDAVRSVMGDWPAIDELVAATPVWIVLTVSFAAWHPFDRRMREAALMRDLDEGRPMHRPPELVESVVRSWRHQALFLLIPLTAIIAWAEIVVFSAPALGIGPMVAGAAQLAGAVVVFAAAPLAIRFTWDTVKLRDGPLLETLMDMANRHGVRVSGVLVWRTGGTTVNAAVSGIVPWIRYVILSDALLEHMSTRHVEAVAAHELAHVRKRHLPWLAVTVLAAVTLIGTPAGWLAVIADGLGAGGVWLSGAIAGVTLLGTFAVLGVVSRRFEWQADAFAVRHLAETHPELAPMDGRRAVGEGAIEVMVQTLGMVASLNGMSPRKWSWRHGSIAERQRRLRSLRGRPIDGLPIDRRVAGWKVGIAGAVVLAGLVIAVEALLLSATIGGG